MKARHGALAAAAIALFSSPLAWQAEAQPAAAPSTAEARKLERQPGARPDPSTDEGGVWAAMDKEEQQVRQSAAVNRDPALNAYVSNMACKIAAEHCKDLRIYVLDQPIWNAFMAPNGMMAVYSGLILRADDEAELACVIGHEAGHFVQNHSIENWRTAKNRANLALMLQLGLAVAGAPSVAGSVVGLATMATIASFSRTQETEADSLGITRMAAAGYDPAACAPVWEKLLAELKASEFRRVQRRGEGETELFDTHPGAATRIVALKSKAEAYPKTGARNADAFHAAVRPHLEAWIRADLRRRDFGSTLHFLDRRIAAGRDVGVYQYFKGEAYRMRRKEGDAALARTAYEAAVAQKDAPALAWRALGDIRAKAGEKEAAAIAYRAYLAGAPQATDRALVERDLASLGFAPAPSAAPQSEPSAPPAAAPISDANIASAQPPAAPSAPVAAPEAAPEAKTQTPVHGDKP